MRPEDKAVWEKVVELLEDNREYIEANERPEYLALYDKGIADANALLMQPVQPENCDPSSSILGLDEMILSDCGCSSNYQPLLNRVAARIQGYIDTPPAAQQEVTVPDDMSHAGQIKIKIAPDGDLHITTTGKDSWTGKDCTVAIELTASGGREGAKWYKIFRDVMLATANQPAAPQPAQQEPIKHSTVAYKLAQKELARLVQENFGRMPKNDEWADSVLDLRDALESQQNKGKK
jgi:hypothetical protein